ncbi:MAG TPA: UDP-N-acetylmuramoyl-tripeptide--D-alanyl-D-alanine ligase [Gammaproteobacteria bacterium]|nr:UDP-N-acetylmuramoyl-tripeptide--D-alanyl-D-alanine ligase [Gammaproteobacteria bacterium]
MKKAALIIDRIRTGGKTLAKHVYRRPFIWGAPLYRRLIPKTRFVGITGSGGKTTTKDLIFDVLNSKFRAHKSHDTNNQLYTVARTMFEIRPGVEYCVQEVGVSSPGSLDRSVELLAPSIAVVTNIRTDHCTSFKDEDAIADEKSKLVRGLNPGGIAILNADDERVLAMAAHAAGTVLTYGTSPSADVRADAVVSEWPEGLRFVVHYRGESFAGRTALHGTYLIHCVLAAVAVGIAVGMTVPECLEAIRNFGPRLGRMSIHHTRRGVTFVRDDWKSPLWSIRHPIDFVSTLPARRRLLVLGTISDYRGASYQRYRDTVKHALDVFDEVLMVGEHAGKAERLSKLLDSQALHGFETVEGAARYVLDTAQSGDVVLIKGPNPGQHLARIALVFDADVRCWRTKCGKEIFCDACALLTVPGSARGTGASSRVI